MIGVISLTTTLSRTPTMWRVAGPGGAGQRDGNVWRPAQTEAESAERKKRSDIWDIDRDDRRRASAFWDQNNNKALQSPVLFRIGRREYGHSGDGGIL